MEEGQNNNLHCKSAENMEKKEPSIAILNLSLL